ncbi:MAG: glycosyltransferase family 2 protein [Planctomycetaceae bacterium]|nr:glycosyltransferase family 2 protein [Planctomycetales bacterium]MCB9874119.1 glycosyltransferase family 2 protein [Planctomycetaceae bacterium]MCB9940572.1 glycosyltransferase family 2 protein [Planctomycetaceae bacterium]
MSTTAKSLSVVVPVHNAERSLTRRIGHLLEVLPDLAAKFEVLIVDDGSTDQTEDVALELSQQYPQVRVTRHPEQLGIEASAQTGAAQTTGDVVIVHAGQEAVNASQLRRAWRHREDEELVVAPAGSNVGGINSEVLRQLEDWGQGLVRDRAHASSRERRTSRSPAVKPLRGPKKPSVPAPLFRFTSNINPSAMHQ